MDYPCDEFGDCTFSRFGSVKRIDTDVSKHKFVQQSAQHSQYRLTNR